MLATDHICAPLTYMKIDIFLKFRAVIAHALHMRKRSKSIPALLKLIVQPKDFV